MTGKITDITKETVEAHNGRPPIKKEIVTVEFDNGDSAAIEFTGELRRLVIRAFKVEDIVDIKYTTKAHKNKAGKHFNNKRGVSISRI